MDNDNENRGEKTPSAWLVTGGRMFKDRAFISEAGAIKSAQERGDGASVEPLYLDDQLPPAPVAEELSSKPVGVVVPPPEDSDCVTASLYLAGLDLPVGTQLYTHPQPAVPDVDALAEYLERNGFLGYPQAARDLSIRICNWIEEQSK